MFTSHEILICKPSRRPPAAPTAPAAPPLVAEARRPRDDPAVILEEYALLDLYKENREEERVAARERAAIAVRCGLPRPAIFLRRSSECVAEGRFFA